MPTIQTAAGQVLTAAYSNNDWQATSIPIDLSTNTPVTLLRQVVAVSAGDTLDIVGEARLTDDEGYTVGVGTHLVWYDVDDGIPWPHAQPWQPIGSPTGDNVTKDRHHIPGSINRLFTIPADWPAGHRIVVVLRVDAHSTAWQAGDRLTVDPYGILIVRHWTTPPPA